MSAVFFQESHHGFFGAQFFFFHKWVLFCSVTAPLPALCPAFNLSQPPRIVNLGLLYQYAFEYTDGHRKDLGRFKTVEAFDKGFRVTDAMFSELVKLADEKGIKGGEEEKRVARREADILLKAYIARNLFDDEGFYPIYAPMDDILQKAIGILEKGN